MQSTTPTRPHVVQPVYLKLSILIIASVALFHGLYCARTVFVPILFAMLLGMLLNPLVNRAERKGMNRVFAITVSVVLAMLVLAGLFYFILTQAAHFSETFPALKEKVGALMAKGQQWVERSGNIEPREVDAAVAKAKEEGMAKGGQLLGGALTTMGTLFGFLFLLPVFTFLLLLYKRLIMACIADLFPSDHQGTVSEVLQETKGVAQSYLTGLIFEAGIITVLNWIGLMVIGVQYALLLAVIAAVLNLIPYIGMIIATILPMIIALATMEPVDALWVLALYAAVQFIDNNFIVPRIVGSRVELNALVSLIGVMAGGVLWGIPGMFLAIPICAILKVTFDRVPALQPFGRLLGDDDTERKPSMFRGRRKRPT
ncbi:MAG TPA: AI-2E family transporter [Flavobacteriales bacterium]